MTEEVTYKPGDVVILKSGGEYMTVESIGDNPLVGGKVVNCVWHDGKKVYRDSFPPAVLTHKKKGSVSIDI